MGKNNAIAITVIISVLILVLAIIALFVYRHQVYTSGKTVTVQGVSNIEVMPDLVTVYFNIETKGKTSSEATTANNDIYDDLIEEMIIAGFEEDDVKTQSFNVYPNTYWEDGRTKTDGYIANHYLRV